MTLNISAKGATKAAFKEFAPQIFRGFIVEAVKAKSPIEVAKFLESATLWDWVPEGYKKFLLSLQPWPLEWLDTKWVVESIVHGNKAAGYLVATSPELLEVIAESVRDIKERLE